MAESPEKIDSRLRRAILDRIESFRYPDGGYNQSPGAARGSAYGCILALGAIQDLGGPAPDPAALLGCLDALRTADGGYANEAGPGAPSPTHQDGGTAAVSPAHPPPLSPDGPSTTHRDRGTPTARPAEPPQPPGLPPATAAAVTLQADLGGPVDRRAVDWLLARCQPAGGFAAIAAAPIPDLLSTATALHALACTGADLLPLRNRCLAFIQRLRAEAGGFCGHTFDDVADCEYTYYGLLALGHLAAPWPPKNGVRNRFWICN